jgi:ATP-dependent RNA helicase RhlE
MPNNIVTLAKGFMSDPQTVAVTPPSTTAERVDQAVYYVAKGDKRRLLKHLLMDKIRGQVLVFSRTKHGANRIVKDLNADGIDAAAIHGNKSQTARQKALGAFKDGSLRVLVATDIAARGIDVEELPQVIQFDLPNVAETYVHRIGRTGRAGSSGQAIAFCDTDEKAYLRDIYKLTKQKIEIIDDHAYVLADDGEPDPQRAIPANGRDKHQHPRNPEHQGGGGRGRGRGRQGGGGGRGRGRSGSGGGGRSSATSGSGGSGNRGRR